MFANRWIRASILTVAALCVSVSVSAQRIPVPVMGRTLEVTLDDGRQVRGELIEATERSLLLGLAPGFESLSFDRVSRVRSRRHNFTARRVFVWSAIGALVSGIGLTVACNEVDVDGCSGVFPAVAISWGVIGGLSGLSITGSAWQDLPIQQSALTPYARFPQGAPTGFGR